MLGKKLLDEFCWKPDAMFLPHGPRKEYLAGPFLYGVDRAAIAKAFKQVQWDVKPLQPTAPVQGRGTMWILQSVSDSPETIVHMNHGEVVITVITKRKPNEPNTRMPSAQAIGEATTLSLCGNTPGSQVVRIWRISWTTRHMIMMSEDLPRMLILGQSMILGGPTNQVDPLLQPLRTLQPSLWSLLFRYSRNIGGFHQWGYPQMDCL